MKVANTNLLVTCSLQTSLFGIFFNFDLILTLILNFDIVFPVDVPSHNDHMQSKLSHAHHTHLTHVQTYMNDINRCQKHGYVQGIRREVSLRGTFKSWFSKRVEK